LHFQSQRTENGETPTNENQFEINNAYHHHDVAATVAHTENQIIVTSPNDVSLDVFNQTHIQLISSMRHQELGEKRVVFHDNDDRTEEQIEEEENDKRPVSKLHRRDTPHHLKNKRVQQHLTDKAANVILSRLKEQPIPTVEEIASAENTMPLSQDVGLPIVDVNQNGIEISANLNGELCLCFFRLSAALIKCAREYCDKSVLENNNYELISKFSEIRDFLRWCCALVQHQR
jgi:hypothetical protein